MHVMFLFLITDIRNQGLGKIKEFVLSSLSKQLSQLFHVRKKTEGKQKLNCLSHSPGTVQRRCSLTIDLPHLPHFIFPCFCATPINLPSTL